MMIFNVTSKKRIALSILGIWLFNIFAPSISYALTSGPSQPETQAFQPAGVSDMVDLSSGDFKYNIPLLEVGGYPLNLNYQGGVGMDDEASWVGLGWNLNVGALNRQLRGLPDDMSGEKITTEHDSKPKITIGGKVTAKVEVKGKGLVKKSAGGTGTGKGVAVGGSLSLGIFNDNYTGMGAEVGANAGISVSMLTDGKLTAGLGLGVNSNTASGAGFDISPYVSLAVKEDKDNKNIGSASLSSAIGYNSRSGMKTLTLGAGYSATNHTEGGRRFMPSYSSSGSLISYNTEPVMPTIQIPYQTSFSSFSLDVGPTEVLVFYGGGVSGYKSVSKVASNQLKTEGYGFLYADRAKASKNAVMDFVREKDNPIIPELKHLAIPVQLPDLFSYTSQVGSGQFRLYRSSAAFGDNEVSSKSDVLSAGIDLGFGGSNIHGGVTLFDQESKTTTRFWRDGNDFLNKGDFKSYSKNNPEDEPVYFKMVGEKNSADVSIPMMHDLPLAVAISSSSTSSPSLFSEKNGNENMVDFDKSPRQKKRASITYLTAGEASKAGLEKQILSYPAIEEGSTMSLPVSNLPIIRNSEYRAEDHFSEITVTDDGGKRMVYGIPAYNIVQEEYSFAIGTDAVDSRNQSTVTYTGDHVNNKKGIDQYYHKEIQPAYASSYLLTAILSPDYVDKTGDGISDDDNGTAIKFNYTMAGIQKWRTPTRPNKATVNKALLADPDDNKASIIYGQKELWYTHSIESKTQIAYFVTAERQDGLGVTDWKGNIDTEHKQRCLKEIRLYSKEDLQRPVKVVKFDYGYDLCGGVPNSANGQGKLTLRKVWFEYGGTEKGKDHPYQFFYKNSEIGYQEMSSDRWGTYKPKEAGALSNDIYPYAEQDSAKAAYNVGVWTLNRIELPTGGIINVQIESDDYAYVQNKRAAVMGKFDALIDASGADINPTSGDALINARGMKITLDSLPSEDGEQTRWFKNTYLNGSDYIYTKLFVKVSTNYSNSKGQDYDYVPVYCKIEKVLVDSNYANVFFEEIEESKVSANPISIAAWQRMKNEYPRYAYRGFDNRPTNGNSDVGRAVKAVVSSISNLGELQENFYHKAKRLGFAGKYDQSKSFIRLVTKASQHKMGGGSRVKRITMEDQWQQMTTTGQSAVYGQEYSYTKLEGDQLISSGVASNEPTTGSDENALRQPVPYIQNIKGAINNYFCLEEPFGESFYPGASVIYSNVTVKDLDRTGQADPTLQTGYVVNEFYTAREFPVRVQVLPLIKKHSPPNPAYSFLSSNSVDKMTLSQAYSIELNDMHGKPKAVRVFNQSGSEISSTVYEYNTENASAGEMRLKNLVTIVNEDGSVSNDKIIGRDIDFFTDMREQEANNEGRSVNIGVDVLNAGFLPVLPLLHWPKYSNTEYKLFRSACAVKVAQYYGILDKVTKTENGSSIVTENVAYDGLTGEPVVTRTQNEFNENMYTVNLPAYWAYKGMGGAYKSAGMILEDVVIDTNCEINSPYWKLLEEGDQLINLSNGVRYWTVNARTQIEVPPFLIPYHTKILIDDNGMRIRDLSENTSLKVIRSAFNNKLNNNMTTVVSLENPIKNGQLMLNKDVDLEAYKIINASATSYDQVWPLDGEGEKEISYMNLPINDYIFKVGTLNLTSSTKIHTSTDPINGTFYFTDLNHNFFNTRLNEIGIRPEVGVIPIGERAGLEFSFHVPVSGTYYIGMAHSGGAEMFINNIKVNFQTYYYGTYSLYPIPLNAGINNVKIETAFGQINETFGFDVINNSLSEISNTSRMVYNILFSTSIFRGSGMVNNPEANFYRIKGGQSGSPLNGTVTKLKVKEKVYNPFINGLLGNWRPSGQYIYNSQRNQFHLSNQNVLNLAEWGYYEHFYSFWPGMLEANWIRSNQITLYDKYGQELENRDALGRYSSAKFDFKGELPATVASNAKNRDLYHETFEDDYFNENTGSKNVFFSLYNEALGDNLSNESHTGNNSGKLIANHVYTMKSAVHGGNYGNPVNYYLRDLKYQFQIVKDVIGLYPNGFEPDKKEYIFNAWIKDDAPNIKTNTLQISFKGKNSSAITVIPTTKVIVEGWKLVEGTMNLTALLDNEVEIRLSNSTDLLIDDIRIHPKDSQMKTYTYNNKSFKLMAELDENCFATFYEYDDEGKLVRVKKETERGIVTLKESRSSYVKR